jgi:TonB-dependent SusC/RagA subfamily outer membrane receptor
MVSLTPRVSLFGVLLVGLTVGCIGNVRPPVNDMPDPSPTRALTGTVVTSDDLDQNPSQPIEKVLQGHIAGVMITQNAEGGISVRIRGQTTLNGGTEPLFIIDGMAIEAGPGGALLGINPHDIASIEVLKDAASLAFYGVRGANGVVLIKTKHSNQ